MQQFFLVRETEKNELVLLVSKEWFLYSIRLVILFKNVLIFAAPSSLKNKLAQALLEASKQVKGLNICLHIIAQHSHKLRQLPQVQ